MMAREWRQLDDKGVVETATICRSKPCTLNVPSL